MRKNHEPTAGDVMTSPVVSLAKDVPLREAAQTLTEHGISGGLVVDDGNRPVGVVSLTDIATFLAGLDRPAEAAGPTYRYSYPKAGEEEWENDTTDEPVAPREMPVGEVMTPAVLSVPKETPLSKAARKMWTDHIHRLFVSDGGRIVGVLTTLDVLRAMTSPAPVRKVSPRS